MKTKIPGFTAGASIYKPNRVYFSVSRNPSDSAPVIVPAQFGPCSFTGALCVAALLDAVPGDEIPICTVFWYYCGGEA